VRYQPLVVGLEDKGGAWPALAGRMLVPSTRAEAFAFRAFGRVGPLAERIRPFAPRLLHAHFGIDGLMALPLARALGIPLVTTLHGHEVSRSRARLLASGRVSWTRYALRRERLMAQGALFLAVSDALRDKAVAQGYPAERTVTHHLGIDLDRFRPQGTPEPGLILHVGRLVEKKGTAVLLDAMARLGPEARLVVIGDGPERAALERRAAALGGRVRFLGALPRDEVLAWMRRAWTLAVPSLTARDGDAEGLPTVLLEAAACGVPAVGSRHSGIPEAIDHGTSGLLVPGGDAEALGAALAAILAEPDLRARMSAAARALVEVRFDAARQIARLEDRYGLLLAR
jgi:glycosyltransferase involved in cell wall biosynthesis